jgi:hypothetical protein
MGATRRNRKTEPPPVFSGLIQIPYDDDGVVDSDNVL